MSNSHMVWGPLSHSPLALATFITPWGHGAWALSLPQTMVSG